MYHSFIGKSPVMILSNGPRPSAADQNISDPATFLLNVVQSYSADKSQRLRIPFQKRPPLYSLNISIFLHRDQNHTEFNLADNFDSFWLLSLVLNTALWFAVKAKIPKYKYFT